MVRYDPLWIAVLTHLLHCSEPLGKSHFIGEHNMLEKKGVARHTVLLLLLCMHAHAHDYTTASIQNIVIKSRHKRLCAQHTHKHA